MMREIKENMFGDFAAHFSARKQPFLFVARGRSMSPVIRDGETVEIHPLHGRVKAGDVVLLRKNDGAFLVHRVVRCTGRGVITRGDACSRDDSPADNEMIVGRVLRIRGRGRSFLLRFPAGYFVSLLRAVRKFPFFSRLIGKIAKPFL